MITPSLNPLRPDALLDAAREVRRRVRVSTTRRKLDRIASILDATGTPDTARAEAAFERLQNAYGPRPEYGYDAVSIWGRAASRSLSLVSLEGMGVPGKKILEVGAGDGMLGVALNAFGHSATLVDQEDWRSEAARGVEFRVADCCERVPFEDRSFDLACSYNSFEHLNDPAVTLNEMVRVVKPGGWIHIDFNPLYSSPWGLHAYRAFRMPYPQFLFSEEFRSKKLEEIGIWDLGTKRTKLQFVNCWKPEQFERLWLRSGCTIVANRKAIDVSHLGIIAQFPEAFRGRQLTTEDVTVAGISLVVKKPV